MKAINSDLVFVGNKFGTSCGCGCSASVFRSVWDRLCRQLFGATPPDIDSETQLPDIDIWKDGVAMKNDSYPYTFIVASDGEAVPKPMDIVEYKGKFFVIGTVE